MDDLMMSTGSPADRAHARLDELMKSNPRAAEAICMLLRTAVLPVSTSTFVQLDNATGYLRAALVDGGQAR